MKKLFLNLLLLAGIAFIGIAAFSPASDDPLNVLENFRADTSDAASPPQIVDPDTSQASSTSRNRRARSGRGGRSGTGEKTPVPGLRSPSDSASSSRAGGRTQQNLDQIQEEGKPGASEGISSKEYNRRVAPRREKQQSNYEAIIEDS